MNVPNSGNSSDGNPTAPRISVRVALLAAVYALLTVLPPFNAIGYGPIQMRVSEALTVLPYMLPWAPWGLYLGCVAANLASPFLVWDVTLGASGTLLAAWFTRKMPKPYLAPLPPIVVNSLVVPIYVARLSDMPYWLEAAYVAVGEVVACYGLGYPLLLYLLRNRKAAKFLTGE